MSIDKEVIKAEIEGGLRQVNENFVLNSFSCAEIDRNVEVKFTFKDNEKELEVETKWD